MTEVEPILSFAIALFLISGGFDVFQNSKLPVGYPFISETINCFACSRLHTYSRWNSGKTRSIFRISSITSRIIIFALLDLASRGYLLTLRVFTFFRYARLA